MDIDEAKDVGTDETDDVESYIGNGVVAAVVRNVGTFAANDESWVTTDEAADDVVASFFDIEVGRGRAVELINFFL